MGSHCVRYYHINTLTTRGAICSAMTPSAVTESQMYQNTEITTVDFSQYMAWFGWGGVVSLCRLKLKSYTTHEINPQ